MTSTPPEEVQPETQIELGSQLQRQYTASEAMFIFEGEALKGSAMVELTAKMTPTDIKKNLMSLDLKFDTLSEYLCNFANVVNQHATMLNTLKKDVEVKCYREEIGKSFTEFAKAQRIRDKQFSKTIKLQERVPKEERLDDVLEAGVNKFINKIDKISTGLDLLYGQNQELFARMNKVEQKTRDLEKNKADTIWVSEKNDMLITLIGDKTNEVQKMCFEKINDNYQKTRKEIDSLFDRIVDCEKKTLMRIRDCEELLKLRASTEYVDNRVDNVKEEVMKLLKGFNNDNSSKIEDWKLSCDESFRLIKETTTLRLDEFRELLRGVENNLLTRVDTIRFEEVRKLHITKIEDLMLKLKENSRKFTNYDIKFGEFIKKMNDKLGKNREKVKDMIEKIRKRLEELEKMIQEGGLPGGGTGGGNLELLALLKQQFQNETKDPNSGYTIERIEKLEKIILKLEDYVKKNGAICLNLQTEIANKIDLTTFTSQVGKKIDREELLDMLGKYNSDEQRMKKLEKELIKMKRKLNESLEILDKKIKKLRKDLDIAYIQKILSGKANTTDVRGEILRIDDSMKESMGLFNSLRNDFENLVLSFKKIAQYIASLQEESATGTLASTKTALCLSCGRGGPKFVPERKQVKKIFNKH